MAAAAAASDDDDELSELTMMWIMLFASQIIICSGLNRSLKDVLSVLVVCACVSLHFRTKYYD